MILVFLKEPPISLLVEGEINDIAATKYDEIFVGAGGTLMAKRVKTGKHVIFPISRDSNIAYLEEVTKEDIEQRRKEAEEKEKEMMAEAMKQKAGSSLQVPGMTFPGSRRGRG